MSKPRVFGREPVREEEEETVENEKEKKKKRENTFYSLPENN